MLYFWQHRTKQFLLLWEIRSMPARLVYCSAKVILAIVAGYLVDIFFKKGNSVPHHEGELCHDCGCHNHSSGIVKPALRHTGKIFLYLFVFTFILNLCIEVLGIDRISAMMLGDTVFQPVIAALTDCSLTVRHL